MACNGYLPGGDKAAQGGLSSFTVDNIAGDRDATVRLYLSGKQPAARSFCVKRGEKFTAKSLRPGTYVMRYRFNGSVETFEAEKDFPISETQTEGGRRYSAVTVRLFKNTDGNLPTKTVAPEAF